MSSTKTQLVELDRARSMALGEQLARRARARPDQIAYKYEGQELSYGELDERVNRLAHALAARGTIAGSRVATLMTNRLQVVETYLAVAKLGAICVPVNFRLVSEEIAYILGDSDPVALVVDAGLAATAAEARLSVDGVDGRQGIRCCLVTDGDPAVAGPRSESYEAALSAASAAAPDVVVSEHQPAFIMYTSGTTGRPKGAVLSHFNLLMNTYNMVSYMGMSGDSESWLSGLPLFHIGGLNGILPYLLLGGTVVMLPSGQFDATEVIDALEREHITGCYFVPTQWQQICAVEGVTDRKLSLSRISWGASVAPPSVLQAMADTFPGVPNFNAFGQTEMSSVTCVLLGRDAVRKMGSVGTPVSNVEVRIVDEETHDVAEGDIGEIAYRGPTVLQSYWGNPDATAKAFEGGWFHSGDLVRRDAEGYIYVVDRKKDMIISGGENIYCAEVEAVLDAHPAVAEVALIGVPDDKWVETPRAVIVPVDRAAPPSEEEIVAWCRERLASYKKPTSIVIVDSLPRNASGKVLKTQLRDAHGQPA